MEGSSDGRISRDDRLLRIVLVVAAAVVLLPMLLMAMAMPMMGWLWTGGMHGGGGWAPLWGVGMMLVPIVLLLLVGYGLYRLATGGERDDPALRELRMAYARGDLSDQEYEERRERLRPRR